MISPPNNRSLDKCKVILDKYNTKPGEHKVKPPRYLEKLVQYLQKGAETKCYLSNISRNSSNITRNSSNISRSAPKQRCIHPVSLCIPPVFHRICSIDSAMSPCLLHITSIGHYFDNQNVPLYVSNGRVRTNFVSEPRSSRRDAILDVEHFNSGLIVDRVLFQLPPTSVGG